MSANCTLAETSSSRNALHRRGSHESLLDSADLYREFFRTLRVRLAMNAPVPPAKRKPAAAQNARVPTSRLGPTVSTAVKPPGLVRRIAGKRVVGWFAARAMYAAAKRSAKHSTKAASAAVIFNPPRLGARAHQKSRSCRSPTILE